MQQYPNATGANCEPLGQRRRYQKSEDTDRQSANESSNYSYGSGGNWNDGGGSSSKNSRWDIRSPTGSTGSNSRSSTNRRSRSRSRDRDRDRNSSKSNEYGRTNFSGISEYASPKTPDDDSATGDGRARRRPRRSRWGNEKEKAIVPGMPTMLPPNLTEDQRKAYLCQLQIEEMTRKLRSGDYGIPPNPEDRSPSPEPVYDNAGKRLNTREVRTRQKLEHQRHYLIQDMLKINPGYKPPPDYKAPQIKLNDKVWIPQDEHPEVNFVGLLIGPRGNTLRQLEKDTGTRIVIRGKGSVKEGKIGKREGPMPGEDEPLHAYITSTDAGNIKKAVAQINQIIEQALVVPEQQNELRKVQLRELAVLNGTLRGDELAIAGGRCSNCGATSHKSWECPDRPNVTANIYCSHCGAAGHIAKDCKNAKGEPTSALDDEYSALMAELGQEPESRGGDGSNKQVVRINLAKQIRQQQPRGGSAAPPWMAPPPPPMMMPPWGWMPPPGSMPPMMPPPPPPPPPGGDESSSARSGGQQEPGGNYWAGQSAMAPPPPPPSLLSWNAVPPPPPTAMTGYGMQGPGGVAPPPPPPPPPPAGDESPEDYQDQIDYYLGYTKSTFAPPPPPPN